MLILHIGLPKSGTTLLQHRVFARADGLTFLHRKHGDAALRIARDLRAYARAGPITAPWYRRRLAAGIAATAAPGQPLLVSEENISLSPTKFWSGGDATPQAVAHRLAALEQALDPALRPLRVVLGIRRQDQWLASRYAESSRDFSSFGQADFDRRMRAIAARDRLDGPLGWLDYAALTPVFEGALGPGSLHLVPLETLVADLDATLDDLAKFLGEARLSTGRRTRLKPGKMRNRLSQGENAWRMRRDGSRLTLVPEIERALRTRFAASNRALFETLPAAFEP